MAFEDNFSLFLYLPPSTLISQLFYSWQVISSHNETGTGSRGNMNISLQVAKTFCSSCWYHCNFLSASQILEVSIITPYSVHLHIVELGFYSETDSKLMTLWDPHLYNKLSQIYCEKHFHLPWSVINPLTSLDSPQLSYIFSIQYNYGCRWFPE